LVYIFHPNADKLPDPTTCRIKQFKDRLVSDRRTRVNQADNFRFTEDARHWPLMPPTKNESRSY
jgi:hypothetical protein